MSARTSLSSLCGRVLSARVTACLLLPALLMCLTLHASAAEQEKPAELVLGNRTIHVFRTSLGAFSAAERAEGARLRFANALDNAGDGAVTVKRTNNGFQVELDGKPIFNVLPGDARELAGETAEALAKKSSRLMQTTWREQREQGDPRATLFSVLRVAAAAAVLAGMLLGIFKFMGYAGNAINTHLVQRVKTLSASGLSARTGSVFLRLASRSYLFIAWLLSLFGIFLFLIFALEQFAHTRAIGEQLAETMQNLSGQMLQSVGAAIPGVFIAIVIFMLTWVVAQLLREFANLLASGRIRFGALNAHTGPPTMRIAGISLWLFALAMAFPYLPGAQTEAFKGLSVVVGIMVSIGASGIVGQIASGMILTYTRALLVGEYVRMQEHEGTVTELGLFVTRLRTGLGEEIALPNALVLANVTRNFSRAAQGCSFVFDTSVTIGYDTPWRQVHAMLMEAAKPITEIATDPAPVVAQTALADFYVAYKLAVYVKAESPAVRARVASDLHASIQDVFNRHGVQIMSPHYVLDPAVAKTVPESQWYTAPAAADPRPPRG